MGTPRRAILRLTNPNPLPLRVEALEISPELAGLLRCMLISVHSGDARGQPSAGSAALRYHAPLTLTPATPGGSSPKRAEAAALFTVPVGGSALLSAEVTALSIGACSSAR